MCVCRVAFNNGRAFKLYFQSSVVLSLSGSTIELTAAYTGVLRVALVGPGTNEQVLDNHADTYLTGAPAGGSCLMS